MQELSQVVITRLIDAMTVSSPKGAVFEMPCRSSFALTFCREGRITYTHRGREYISDRDHALILPKGAAYRLYRNEAGSFPLVNFQCQGLAEDVFLRIPLGNPESYLREFELIKNALLFPCGHARAMSILYGMLYRLSYETAAFGGILQPALRYLEDSLGDPELSNSLLAEKCGISEVYFRKLFREQFGTSPRQYILELRLQKARQLLAESRLPVQNIAELCGFTNPYHFSRAFRQATNRTPTEYRKDNSCLLL